jgi:Uma2 family endonuclease
MVTEARGWVRADLDRLPEDGHRYEVLDGELFVTPLPPPRHQFAAAQLAARLLRYCRAQGVGEVLGPAAVVFDDSTLWPDVEVLPSIGRFDEDLEWEDLPLPLLVIEVLDDVTRRRDLGKKRAAYRRIGIPTLWLVDIDERHVIAHSGLTDAPVIVTDVLRWQPRGDVPPLEIPLETVF